MRRPVLLGCLVAIAAGLVVAAVGLAGDRDAGAPVAAAPVPVAEPDGPFARAAQEHDARRMGSSRRMRGHHRLHARLVGDLAERLAVSEPRLRAALRDVKQRARARGDSLLRATPARRAAIKERLARELGNRLGIPSDRVVAAVRAEIEKALGIAVTFGAITKQGRDLALKCFDDPATCDLAAVRHHVGFHHDGRT
jgi:hypothetical protein